MTNREERRRAIQRLKSAGIEISDIPVSNIPTIGSIGRPPKKVLAGYVHNGTVRNVFLESLLNAFVSSQETLGVYHAQSGALVARGRNLVAGHFLESDADYLLMVDTDMVFDGAMVDYLVASDKPLIGALYYGVGDDHHPFIVALRRDDDVYARLDPTVLDEGDVIEVDGLGMGFTLIRRDVLEATTVDWEANWPFAESVVDGRSCGEDLTFCLRAKEAGFQPYLATKCRAGHEKSVII